MTIHTELVSEILSAARGKRQTIAVAESLTGGQLCSALVAVPGASVVVRGGVVAYATELKASVLGVDPEILTTGGPVQASVASQMACGVRHLMGADIGVATTGVAGPRDTKDGPAGLVYIAVCARDGAVEVVRKMFEGDRNTVRAQAVVTALEMILAALDHDRR